MEGSQGQANSGIGLQQYERGGKSGRTARGNHFNI